MIPEERRLRRLPIEPWRPAHRVQLHDDAYLDRFIDAAMRVLERTGVKVLSDKAVAVFREHGAAYDAERRVLRLTEKLVRGALASAPRTFTLGSRDGSCDLDLASGATYMTADGCGTEVVDWRTGERRASTKADLEDVTRMRDCLGSIATGGRRSAPATAARRPSCTSSRPAGTTPASTSWAWCRASARRATRSRWRQRWPAGPRSSAAGPS